MQIDDIKPRKETTLPNNITVTSVSFNITLDDHLTVTDQTSLSFGDLEYVLGTYEDHEIIVSLAKEYFKPANLFKSIKSSLGD